MGDEYCSVFLPMVVAYRAYYISMYVRKKQVAGEVSLTPVTSSANGWFPLRIFSANVYTGSLVK